MSKEKQMIEELAAFLWKNTLIHTEDLCHDVAETVIIEGYRKQSEGEWIITRTERAWNNGEYPMERGCSVCGLRRNVETQYAWKFCPHCGAKMKGV